MATHDAYRRKLGLLHDSRARSRRYTSNSCCFQLLVVIASIAKSTFVAFKASRVSRNSLEGKESLTFWRISPSSAPLDPEDEFKHEICEIFLALIRISLLVNRTAKKKQNVCGCYIITALRPPSSIVT